MELHLKNLATLCRVCGNKVIKDRGYQNPKPSEFYADQFKQHFNIDPLLDDKEVLTVFYNYTKQSVFLEYFCFLNVKLFMHFQ